MKKYIIDTISKETLQEYGYDASLVSDEQMEVIAGVLRNTFKDWVLENLPHIAEEYEIPESIQTHYVVSRMYISLNEDIGNRNDCKIFYNKEDALSQLQDWRNNELDLRKESDADYEIVYDDEERFQLRWDDDREVLSIGIAVIAQKMIKRKFVDC